MKIDFQAAEGLMQEAVRQGIFPGAVLWVSANGNLLLHRAYGMADLFSRRSMTCDTVFDLASLTKPLATTLAVMLLVQQGRLALDRPCSTYWPRFRGDGREAISIRQLLCHCSGLPDWRPYHLYLHSVQRDERAEALRRAVLAEPLAAAPGQRSAYSDLGFMVLQGAIEEVSNQPLDAFLRASVYGPLGLDGLFFVPQDRPAPPRPYAATELCPLRGKLLVGEVHDDNAHISGGVAGHAGLFGTAQAVAQVLHELFSAFSGRSKHPVFEKRWVQRFFERQIGSGWALGFDTPSAVGSSAGKYFSEESVGHLGYTGTSFWMECRRGILVVLLTNRVHPSRYNTAIKAFRPRLHDAVMNVLVGSGSGST